MTVSSLRDRIITEMGVCHSDPSYTYPSPQEWQLDNPHAMSKTLAEVLGKAIYPEISTSTLLAWREPVIDYYDPTGGLPAFPSVDDRYISTATANGWTADYIYTWDGSSWSGFAPEEGCTVYNESTDVHQTFNGTTWGTLTTVTKLDDIQDPDSSHVLTMSDKTLTWRFTNPVGGMYFEWIGAASGHLLELNQNTGNPSAGTHLLHLEATDTDVVPIHIRHSAKTADALITDVAGDTNYRFHLTADGKVQWGSGSAAEDTNLYRSGAGVLRTDGSFDIGNIPNYSSGTNVLVSHSGVVKYRLVSDSILSVGDFGEAVDDRVNSLLVQGSGIVLNYNDVGDSLTISLGTHALNHGDGGSDEIAIDWSQITSGVPAQATDWPTWSQVTGKPTNFVYGSSITSANSGYYTKVANDDQIEPALLQDILDGATWYTDCWSKFRIVSVDTNASSNKVVVLGASNELEKRDIDSRVWGSSSLLSNNSLTTNRIPKYTGSNELSNSIVASGDHHLTVEPAGTSQQTYQLQLINAYNSNAARSYIGQYQGHLYITNNRYYNGSWNSNTSNYGCYYMQSSNGHHIFKHFPAGSNTTVQDLVINGPSGFIRSEHNFRLGSNSISNDGTGGLTFDTEGKGTISAPGTYHTYQLKLAGNTSRRAYLGMYEGNTYLTTNRYYNGSSWQSDITGAGIFYMQHNSGYHEFKHFDSGSGSSTRDLLIDGVNTYTESLHYFRVKNKLKADLYDYSQLTTGSGSSGSGQWTRIARVNLTGQYQSASCTFEIAGSNSGASGGLFAKVRFRVKQQASLGDAPFIDLDIFDYQRLTDDYFKTVTVQNDASATIVDLYVTMVDSYVNYVFTPYNVYQDSKFTFYSLDGLTSSLPSGAQTDAVPRALVFSSDGDATTPRDLDVSRYFHSVGAATFDASIQVNGQANILGGAGIGGNLELGGNWISYASGDRGMKIDDLSRAVFKIDANRIGNIVLQNDYNSNTVKSYIGQNQNHLFICNNAYYNGDWYPDLSSDYSERLLFIDGVFRMDYSVFNSPISWTRVFHFDGPDGKAGFFTDSPAATLHVHESSTGGTDEDLLTVTTQSGGGFSVRCSDLSASNPTWKLRSNGSEAMELFVGTNDGQLTLNTDGTTTFGGSVKLNNLSSIDATRDIRKTSDETNSTNSLQDDNHLTFTAEANTKYYVNFELFVNLVSSASNEGFKFDITGPSSPTAVAYRGYGISDTDGMVIPSGGEATAFSTSRTIPFSVSSAHNGVVKIRLYLDNGSNSGSVTLRWAWDQGGGLFDNVTVYKESFMTVKSAA